MSVDTALAQVFLKTAEPAKAWSPLKGGLPLAALVGGALLYGGMRRGAQRAADADYSRRLPHVGATNQAGVNAALRGGAALNPVGSSIYANERADSGMPGDYYLFDKESAVAAGCILAKSAGIGGLALNVAKRGVGAIGKLTPSMGWKSKVLLGAGALGAGMAAYKGGKKLTQFGLTEPTPVPLGGHSAALPQYTNQFGMPTW